MSLEPHNTKPFDVVGPGYVPEKHADDKYRYLLTPENKAIGGMFVWLTFYVIAVVAVLVTNFDTVADVVVAALK